MLAGPYPGSVERFTVVVGSGKREIWFDPKGSVVKGEVINSRDNGVLTIIMGRLRIIGVFGGRGSKFTHVGVGLKRVVVANPEFFLLTW